MNSSTSLSELRPPKRELLSASADSGPEDTAEVESWSERFYAALPLFFVGGACVVVAVELYVTGNVTAFGGNISVRLRPWILFLALGITGLSAGIVALFAEEETEEPRDLGKAVVAPPPAPAWDDSWIEPETRVIPRHRTWETGSGALDGSPAEPSSPDLVLQQLDEIELSLRKKHRTPPPD
jgi:hypothetical protein